MHSSNKNITLLIEYPDHKILNFCLFLCILQTSPSLSHSLHTLRFERKNRNQVCKPERNKNSQVCICHTFHTGVYRVILHKTPQNKISSLKLQKYAVVTYRIYFKLF